MKDINELISKSKKYNDVILQKEFKSKKNTVVYVIFDGKSRVLKWFIPGLKQRMQNEFDVTNVIKIER